LINLKEASPKRVFDKSQFIPPPMPLLPRSLVPLEPI